MLGHVESSIELRNAAASCQNQVPLQSEPENLSFVAKSIVGDGAVDPHMAAMLRTVVT